MNYRRSRLLAGSAALLLLVTGVVGCGSDVGTPGSSGGKDIGAIISTRVLPTYLEVVGVYDVDVRQEICEIDDEGTIEFEPFTRHDSLITFNPQWLVQRPRDLTINRYTVEFFNSVPGTPPIESYERFVSMPILSSDTEAEFGGMDFIDLDRKDAFLADMESGVYPRGQLGDHPSYTAQYTFWGKDSDGDDFRVEAAVTFFIGLYDNCP